MVGEEQAALTIGEVTVRRVIELDFLSRPPLAMFADLSPEAWDREEHWLAPDHYDRAAGLLATRVQSWVLQAAGTTVIVDTGVGNQRDRAMPAFDHLHTEYLRTLAAAGVRPDDVDLVVNTHLHADHVGWNTRRDGDAWVPTFPRARYLLPRADLEYWDPSGPHEPRGGAGNAGVFEDSIAPVLDAGQVDAWDEAHEILAGVRLEPAPGHTPGSSMLTVSSAGEQAFFVGDLLHNPVQVPHPDVNSCFCEDPATARATRRRVLARAADEGALLVPAHFRDGGVARIARAGDDFAVAGWVDAS